MFKKIIWTLLILLVTSDVYAQQTGTPATLRVRIDANGYLLLSATSQTNPVTTSVFGQARLKTDASGNLLVVLTGGGTGAPANGPYITFTANATLTGAQNVGLLSTGLLLNTVSAASGTVSRYAGTSCTNQFPRSLNNSGAATCASVAIGSDVSGLGTGIATALGVNTGLAGAPVLFNGALGTPTSGTLSSATGLPISTGVSGLGANVATFLATPTSANLASAVTDETGSGSLVFGTSPTFTTPILGTPTSGTLTNATGLPEGGLSLTDITTNNATSSQHGFLPKLSNTTTTFLNGQGAFTTPSTGTTILSAVTSAQFDKTNTTLTDIPGLSLTLTSGKTYIFRAELSTTQDVTGGFKLGFGGTLSLISVSTVCTTFAGTTVSLGKSTSGGICSAGASGVAASSSIIEGVIIVNGGGTMTMQYAQNTATGTSSVLVNSSFYAILTN